MVTYCRLAALTHMLLKHFSCNHMCEVIQINFVYLGLVQTIQILVAGSRYIELRILFAFYVRLDCSDNRFFIFCWLTRVNLQVIVVLHQIKIFLGAVQWIRLTFGFVQSFTHVNASIGLFSYFSWHFIDFGLQS